ncbi:required for meiotic nuclear division protein 1 homolog [Trichonephila clavata]|uniref:Required for meiotic nuclear division protein 1 homolog n=1 Tax=Trichonephila clavata TaxID=2740835 RepID=A0A8X6KR57_TRICU|nr:required for meiotic nuclear division protein 1 homolog [Trichonephila clavata]
MAKVLIVLWIIINCDKKSFKGMRWDNRADGVFWLYWRHQSSRSCRENSRESYEYYEYYRAWAKHKNNMKRKQPRDLKAAFRNALEKKSELERLSHLDTKDRIYWRIKNINSFQYDPTKPFDEIQTPEKGTANRSKKETSPNQKYSVQNNREFPVNFGASTSSSSEEFSSFHYNPAQSFEQKPIKSTSSRGRRGALSSQNHSVQNNGFPVNNGASTSNAREELPYERKRSPKATHTTKTRGQPGRKTWSRRKRSVVSETITSPAQTTCYPSAANDIPIDYEGTNNRSALPPFEELHESWRNNIPNATLHSQQFHDSSFHERRDEDVWTPQYFSTVDRCTPPQHSSDILGNQTEIMDFYAPTPPTSVTSYPFQPTPPQQNTDISFDNYNTEFKTLERNSKDHSTPIKYSYPFLQGETRNAQIQLNDTRISPVPPTYSVLSPASQSRCSNLQDLQATKLNNISRNYYPLDHRHFSSPSDHQQYLCQPSVKNVASNRFSYLDTPPRDAFLDENFSDVEAPHHQHHSILHQNHTGSHEMENCVSEMIDNLSNSEIENILESVNSSKFLFWILPERSIRLVDIFFTSDFHFQLKMLGGKAKTFFSLSWNILQHSNIASCRRMSNAIHINFKWNSGGNNSFLLPIRSLASKSFNIRKLSSGNVFSTTDIGGVQKSIAALQAKKRVPRKKVLVRKDALDQEVGEVIAYSSAEEYDIQRLSEALDNQGLYQHLQLPSDAEEVIHVIAKYKVDEEPREIYFFSEGSVVFWNVPDLEQQNVLRFLKPYETNSYDPELVNAEKEDMDYIHSDKGPKFSKGRIILNSEGSTDFYTYTFSNGLALSVKLAMWEAALENYIDSMEWVTENMKRGEKISMTREQVFKKRGELFALRHVINLSSDLLDTPDFYWDRQDLENLYQQICNHLNIAKRTKVMNERLSYCSELIDLLGNHMNDKHHVRLEWMIIILIMVEVMFECIHFIEQIFH